MSDVEIRFMSRFMEIRFASIVTLLIDLVEHD